jgi:hypothetical protein
MFIWVANICLKSARNLLTPKGCEAIMKGNLLSNGQEGQE